MRLTKGFIFNYSPVYVSVKSPLNCLKNKLAIFPMFTHWYLMTQDCSKGQRKMETEKRGIEHLFYLCQMSAYTLSPVGAKSHIQELQELKSII